MKWPVKHSTKSYRYVHQNAEFVDWHSHSGECNFWK